MIYLDSCIVIYLVEKVPGYYSQVDKLLRQNLMAGFAVSSLVVAECLVGPLKSGDEALTQAFETFFSQVNYFYLDDATFRGAAEKRASLGVKMPDALHLTTAEANGCSEFWTNDNRLQNKASIAINIFKV